MNHSLIWTDWTNPKLPKMISRLYCRKVLVKLFRGKQKFRQFQNVIQIIHLFPFQWNSTKSFEVISRRGNELSFSLHASSTSTSKFNCFLVCLAAQYLSSITQKPPRRTLDMKTKNCCSWNTSAAAAACMKDRDYVSRQAQVFSSFSLPICIGQLAAGSGWLVRIPPHSLSFLYVCEL